VSDRVRAAFTRAEFPKHRVIGRRRPPGATFSAAIRFFVQRLNGVWRSLAN
jgi:hypothetical protein